MLTLHTLNEVWIRVECEPSIARELSDYFTFEAPGAKFMPAFRKRHWDGKIRLFKLKGHLIYKGLIPRIQEFADDRGYTVDNQVATPVFNVPPSIEDFAQALGLPHTARDYQLAALEECKHLQRGVIVSPTGSGKSLIIYVLSQMFEQYPVLIVVPTINLVTQMCSDFKAYGMDVAEDVHLIVGGADKQNTTGAPIYISTWQSIYEQPPEYFAQFKMVIVDEVHLAKAKSLTGLMEKCPAALRFGLTGTLDDMQINRLILEGLFGSVTKVATTAQLQKAEHLAPLKVKMCVLQYPEQERKLHRHDKYPDEVEFIVTNPARDEFIAQLVASTKGNTLVLFQYVEKHGLHLVERIRKAVGQSKTVHFISGQIDASERERIRQAMEAGTDEVLVASYGTTSLGVNITNIRNLVLASPSKSKIRVLQSIGRALRMSAGKAHATLIDIVDDLRIGKHINFTFGHAQSRIEYYSAEKFPYTLHQFPLSRIAVAQTAYKGPQAAVGDTATESDLLDGTVSMAAPDRVDRGHYSTAITWMPDV